MSVQIQEVVTKKELNKFIQFPNRLYKGNPYYIPALNMDERKTFSTKNPSREYCNLRLWLAYKDNKIVGRIAGIINTRANELFKQKKVRFGWFDTINDIEVCRALVNTVEQWGLENNLTEIHGPLGFTDMDKECLLVKGFDVLSSTSNWYNYEYYIELLEKTGFKSECEWIQYEIPASQPVPDKIERINELIKEKYKLKVPEFKSLKKEIMPYARKFFHALNASFEGLYGFVPLTEKEIDWYLKQYFPFLKPQFISLIIDEMDEIAGFGVSLPSLSRAYQKAKGRLFPFGWYHLLRALHKYDYIDLYMNGVRPEWQHKGIHSLYYAQMNKAYIKYNVQKALTNPQIDGNEAVKIWEKYEGYKEVIRRRVYGKDISPLK